MRKLYRDKSTLHPVLQWTAAAVCAAAYFLCCLPSFRLIGRFALQMLLSVVLSAGCTAVFFFAVPRSLRVIGKALSLFLLAMLTLALVGQVQEQIRLGGYPGWAHTFFYDRPLTVAVVWATGFILLSALRLFLPYRRIMRGFSRTRPAFSCCFILACWRTASCCSAVREGRAASI